MEVSSYSSIDLHQQSRHYIDQQHKQRQHTRMDTVARRERYIRYPRIVLRHNVSLLLDVRLPQYRCSYGRRVEEVAGEAPHVVPRNVRARIYYCACYGSKVVCSAIFQSLSFWQWYLGPSH